MNYQFFHDSRPDPFAVALTVALTILAPAAAHGQTTAATPPQTPTPAQTTAPAQPAPTAKAPGLVFASDAGVVFTQVIPSKAVVYEEVIGKVRELLRQSANPVRKQQAAGWRVFKASEPYNERVLYVSVMDTAVPGATYNVFDLLQEVMGDMPARELFEKFRAAHAGPQFVLNLSPADKPAVAADPIKK